MEKLLVFTRPFTNTFSKQYLKEWSGEAKTISDFKWRDELDFMGRLYRHFGSQTETPLYDEIDYESTILRCRYLRFLPRQTAVRLVNAAYSTILEIYNVYPFDYVVGLCIDNYILDLLCKFCEIKNIRHTFPLQSFLPDLTRMTNRGEFQKARSVSDSEVEKYAQILGNKKFKPKWLSREKTKKDVLKLYLKERGKKAFFETMKLVKSDPYSFHYNCIYPMPGAITVKNFEVVQSRELYFSKMDEILPQLSSPNKTVFFPLQFTPETTYNYFIDDATFHDYEGLVQKIIKTKPQNVTLILKEHPDMFGYRDNSFYKNIKEQNENVYLADVDTNVNEIFEIAQHILVTGSASTGAEGIFKDKNVIALGGAYYSLDGKYCHEIKNFNDVPFWSQKLSTPIQLTEDEKFCFLRRILENTLPGPYDFVRTKKSKLETTRKNVLQVLSFLKSFQSA